MKLLTVGKKLSWIDTSCIPCLRRPCLFPVLFAALPDVSTGDWLHRY